MEPDEAYMWVVLEAAQADLLAPPKPGYPEFPMMRWTHAKFVFKWVAIKWSLIAPLAFSHCVYHVAPFGNHVTASLACVAH